MLGLNMRILEKLIDRKPPTYQLSPTTLPRNEHAAPRSEAATNRLILRQTQQIMELRAALREIEHLPFRSRRAQEIARAARMARLGDIYRAEAARRVRQAETEGA